MDASWSRRSWPWLRQSTEWRQDGYGHVRAVAWDSRHVNGEPVRRGRGRPRLPQLRLTAPETVAITSDQYRQAVDVLASMILGYYFYARHCAAVPLGEQAPTAG